VLDGAPRLGAKILISGGGRCNVTNATVEAADFWCPRSPFVRRVLRRFGAAQAAAFFGEIGVALHEEAGGKLFPDTNRARSVLDALLGEAARRGVRIETGRRVTAVAPVAGGYRVETTRGPLEARRVVIATGGLSIPKSGSDGAGYAFARALGHAIVPTTPALAPLRLSGAFHGPLSGVAVDAEIVVRAAGDKAVRVPGALLFTHFGVSGPAALDASRFWHRAREEGREVRVEASFLPGERFETLDAWLLGQARARPRQTLVRCLATRLPEALALAVLAAQGQDAVTPLGQLRRDARMPLVRSLLEWPLPVVGSRGYDFAEVTSGGVSLDEVDPATMESRFRAGLHFVGEVLDVDGRIGGFNFQWAWSSAFVAGTGIGSSEE